MERWKGRVGEGKKEGVRNSNVIMEAQIIQLKKLLQFINNGVHAFDSVKAFFFFFYSGFKAIGMINYSDKNNAPLQI